MYCEDFQNAVRDSYSQLKNYKNVARLFQIDVSTIYYIVKNDYNRDKKRRGQPSKISEKESVKIKRVVRKMNSLGYKVTAKIIEETPRRF